MYYITQDSIIKVCEDRADTAILSPALYWHSKKNYPFSSTRKIKNIALKSAKSVLESCDSVFINSIDDMIETFVYDKKAILKRFKEENLEIEKLYFANSLAKKVDENKSIKCSENIYLNILGEALYESDNKSSDIVNIKSIPLHDIRYEKFTKSENLGYYYTMVALLAVGLVLNIVSWNGEFEKLEKVESSIKLDSYRTDALIKKYERIDKTQSDLRDSFAKASSYVNISCSGAKCEAK